MMKSVMVAMMLKMNYTKLLCVIAFLVSLALAGRNSLAQKDLHSENSIRFQRTTRLDPEAIPLLKSIRLSVGRDKIIANIYRGEYYELLRFWTPDNDDYRLLYTMQSEPREGFENPRTFHQNGENFIYVSTTPTGSAGFVNETILWIAPDKTMHPVELIHADQEYDNTVNQGELVLGGGPGIVFSRDKLSFEFYIARDSDPHCCPTGGKVTGIYRLDGVTQYDSIRKKFACSFRIVPQNFKRTSIPSAELAKFNPASK